MTHDIMAEFRPVRVWRQRILENPDDLGAVIRVWHETLAGLIVQIIDGGLPEVPKGFSDLTYLLATACDVGPARIDPSALTDCLAIVEDPEGYPGTGTEMHKAMAVCNRMIYAWVALDGKEPPPPIETTYKPTEETLRVIGFIKEGMDVDTICGRTGKSAASVRQIKSRHGKRQYKLES